MFSRSLKLVQVHDSRWTVAECLPEFVRLTSCVSTLTGLQDIVKKFHGLERAQHTIVLQVFAKDTMKKDLLVSLGTDIKIKYRLYNYIYIFNVSRFSQGWIQSMKSWLCAQNTRETWKSGQKSIKVPCTIVGVFLFSNVAICRTLCITLMQT
jgi:hypothetical protein